MSFVIVVNNSSCCLYRIATYMEGCAILSIIRLFSVAYYVANIQLFGLNFSVLGVSFRQNLLGKFQ